MGGWMDGCLDGWMDGTAGSRLLTAIKNYRVTQFCLIFLFFCRSTHTLCNTLDHARCIQLSLDFLFTSEQSLLKEKVFHNTNVLVKAPSTRTFFL